MTDGPVWKVREADHALQKEEEDTMGKVLLGAAVALTALGAVTVADAASVAIGSGANFKGFDNATTGATSGSFVSNSLGMVTISWTTGSSSFATASSITDKYLLPQGDTSTYIFATGGSNATVSWTNAVDSVTIYWGSPDSYNTLLLSNGDSVTGTDVRNLTGAGEGDNAGTRWITISDPGDAFTGFTAMSSQAAFEFDMSAVPEPSTWAMLGLGFAGLAFAGFHSRKSAISIA